MEGNSTDVIADKELFFGWLDMTFFILMLVISTLIGIYFGIWGKKEDTPKEYLHGGKTMGTVPVAVSLVASFISGIMVMGAPTEIYLYGVNYWLICLSIPIVGAVTHVVFLPVFFELQLTSTYEYLQLRFNRSVRIMASFMSTFGLILYLPIVVYIPALAFSQVSGISVHFITPGITILCVFYTMMGGIKAVIWTDFLQGILMVVASIAVIILGVVNIGGFGTIWQRSMDGGRLNVNFDPSPFVRLTFWSVVIGHSFHWIAAISINQPNVQKFLSLPSYNAAKKSLLLFVVLLIIVVSISCLTGLVIYATYFDCDLIQSKIVSRPDQILPYFVMDVAASIPGLPGLFVAGIFSASLSTMSSSLNAVGATLFEDFVRPCLKKKISDRIANNIIKFLVSLIGAICVLIVFVVDQLGSVLQLTFSMEGLTLGAILGLFSLGMFIPRANSKLTFSSGGITLGATLGLFSLGMFIPRANSKGALVGSISSMVFMGWIVFGTQKAIAEGTLKQPVLSSRIDGCTINATLPDTNLSQVNEEVFILYRLSFLFYVMYGVFIIMIIGTIVSYLTEPPDLKQTNPILFMPVVRKIMEKKRRHSKTESAEKEFLTNIPLRITTTK